MATAVPGAWPRVPQVLQGVHIVKMLGLERVFEERVKGHRAQELTYLRQRKFLDAACVYFWVSTAP